MHYVKVNIRRDETADIFVHVGAWEVPVLEAKHGDERLTVGELVEFKDRKWPDDARSEMQRINKLYGVTGSGDDAPTFAEKAYGSGSQGVKALAAAIAKARSEAQDAAPKRKPGRPKNEDLVGAIA